MSEQAIESDTSEEPVSLVDAAEPQLGEGEYFLTDGIKGTGDRPEWYLSEKYKSVSDQAAAYNELSKKFGAFKGAPKDGYSMPEGIDQEDELMQELVGFANESNMSQDYFNKAWELLWPEDAQGVSCIHCDSIKISHIGKGKSSCEGCGKITDSSQRQTYPKEVVLNE